MKNDLFVFDTNVLISALFNDSGTPGMALKKARSRGVLVVSDEVAAEYVSVFPGRNLINICRFLTGLLLLRILFPMLCQ